MANKPFKSLSQIWKRSQENGNASEEHQPHSRRQLDRQFNSVSNTQHPMMLRNRSVLSSLNLNVSNVPRETRKLIQVGAEKMNQTIQDVRVTFNSLSQRLKKSTRRRQRLVNSSPYTPNRQSVKGSPRSRQLLGRTPTKLYSPFGIETPTERHQHHHQNLYGKQGKYTPTQSSRSNLGPAFAPPTLYSPSQAFPKDVQQVRRGMEEFNRAAEGAVRRSLRQQLAEAKI